MSEVVEVMMGSLKIAEAPTVLATGGIGSCVALCLFHPATKKGALAHIMLPNRFDQTKPITEEDLRYADAAIAVLVQQFSVQGIQPSNLIAKMVGGASMFPDVQGRSVRVGEKNITAIKQILTQVGISLAGEDIGGSIGRAITFDLGNGVVQIRTSI